jgi:c-di-GMP-binding flagellar brake protein YcgR
MGLDDTADWSRGLGVRRPTRKYPRLDVELRAEYEAGSADEARPAKVLTLGGGGLFLGIGESIAPGTEISVRFRPGPRLPVVRTKVRVLYQVPNRGIGLEFLDITTQHQQAILRLIHQKMEENRKFPRAPLAVQVQHPGGMAIGFSRDISIGGMFIETSEKFDPNSSVGLRFHVDDSGQIVIATAEIRYIIQKLGMGVEFSEMSPEDRERIESYINAGKPATPDGQGA